MSDAALTFAAPGGMVDILARLSALDARLRGIDPRWVGISTTTGADSVPGVAGAARAGTGPVDAGASALDSPASFAQALAGLRVAGATESDGAAGSEDGQFLEPVGGATISQGYGPTTLSLEPAAVVNGVRYAHFHDGLDLAAPLGTPVRAAASGTVVAAGRQADGAVVVTIRHADGSETRYGHLEPDLDVSAGDHVGAGQQIGKVGLTGNTTGPHLHFELVVDGQTVDPEPWLEAGRLPGAATSAAPSASSAAVSDPAAISGSTFGTAGSVASPDSPALASDPAEQAFDAVAAGIPYADDIRSAASAAGVDPLLLASLVRAESGFRADAVSSAGALGLTQLMPANVRSMGVGDPFDAARNLAAGARYLANNLHLYGRVDLALAAYQAGKGAVAQAGGIPNNPTTRNYVSRILGYWAGYLEQGREAA